MSTYISYLSIKNEDDSIENVSNNLSGMEIVHKGELILSNGTWLDLKQNTTFDNIILTILDSSISSLKSKSNFFFV